MINKPGGDGCLPGLCLLPAGISGRRLLAALDPGMSWQGPAPPFGLGFRSQRVLHLDL